MKTKKKSKIKIWIITYILTVVLLYIVIYWIPRVSDIFIDTYTAEYGTLEKSVSTEYVTVRTERLYFSDNEGAIDRKAAQGSLRRAHTRILNVGGNGYYSGERGTVSYFYDGLEDIYTPDTMEDLKEGQNFKQKPDDKEKSSKIGILRKCAEGNAQVGTPIFKIVDNSKWYMVTWLNNAATGDLSTGRSILVEIDESEPIPMEVFSIKNQGTKKRIILSCDRNYNKYDKIRKGKCRIIKNSSSGIIIEKDSIVKEKGVSGVYILNKLGNAKFVPVNVLLTDGDRAVVSSNRFFDEEGREVLTISNYATVLRANQEE